MANLSDIVSRRRGSGKVPQCEICKPVGYHSGKQAEAKCLECSKMLCTACVELHRRTKVTRGHSLVDAQVEKSIGCKVHLDEVVRFYCEPCEMCICILCTFQEHKGHNVQSFSEGMQQYQDSLDTLVTSCKERIICVKDHLDMIKACESEIRKAEDAIRDTTIESISAIRQSEKQLVEDLYDAYGEDTLQFLKEKNVLQDILDNLMSTCNLTEIILKDKSIELLLLRREIQDKLEVVLQGRITPVPRNIRKQVTFNSGQVAIGQLVVDGTPILNGDGPAVVRPGRKCDFGVQTLPMEEITPEPWGNLQTDDDKLRGTPEMSDISVNTCPPDRQTSTTMTDRVRSERTSVQTDATSLVNRGVTTQITDNWSQFTNTPSVQQVDRSTLTTKINMSDSQTETKNLVDYTSTICGPELPTLHTSGTLTDPPDVRSKTTNTKFIEQADKKISTAKLITHDVGMDTEKANTHDFGVMTKHIPGVDKAIGTKTIVLSDMATGGGELYINTADASTDTIWKGIRRVRHKATMHELLYNTQETDTDNLIKTQERASSPCPISDEQAMASRPKRKQSKGKHQKASVHATSETQTDLNLNTLAQILMRTGNKDADGLPVVSHDRGTTMASCVRVTDIGSGTVQVRIIDRGMNTRTIQLTDSHTNTPKVRLVDTESDPPLKKDKGVATAVLKTANKETSTVATRTREKGTETYIQSVEKATYMIQPVILSTGTNTPMQFTSDKKSETDFDRRDVRTSGVSTSVGGMANTTAAAATTTAKTTATLTRDTKRPSITTDEHSFNDYTPGVAQSVAGPVRIRRERDQAGESNIKVQVRDASTSTSSLSIPEKDATKEPKRTCNMATMTYVLMSDIGVLKRPHAVTRTNSMKKIKTADSETAILEPRHMKEESAAPTANASTETDTSRSHKQQKSSGAEKPRRKSTGAAGKNTATFKVELKSTGVGTPIVNFRDRESSPIRIGMFDKSTSMSNVDLSKKGKVQPSLPYRTPALTTDRASSPARFPPYIGVGETDTKPPAPLLVDRGSSALSTATKDCGTGMAHVNYYEKETCTDRIRTMHKNVATENIGTADKQTATVDVSAAYRDLINPKVGSPITVSRGTCTGPPNLTDRETSPIRELPFQVDKGTVTVRKIYVNKGVSVTKADLVCPEKFHKAGQNKQRILPKNMPAEEPDSKFVPMATIQEGSSDDETCSGVGNTSPGISNRLKMFEKCSRMDSSRTTHKEKLWVTAPRLGQGGADVGGGASVGSVGCSGTAVGNGGGCSGGSGSGKGNCSPPTTRDQGGQSTFSANGSTQTSSILCKVETGTSTPPVETEDKAMCTESYSIDGKITECISKLRAVSQRLEAQTTSLVVPETMALAGPIYSKADSFRRESLTTQANCSPVLSGRVVTKASVESEKSCSERGEGLAPLLGIPRRPMKRLGNNGGRLGDMEAACPPFLARRELHSIDTGMVSGGASINNSNGGALNLGTSTPLDGASHKSKARKQRLDITQLLHRPLGVAGGVPGGMVLPGSQRTPYKPSLAGPRLGALDESSRQQMDAAHRRLRAKMSAMEEDDHPSTSSSSSSPMSERRRSKDSGEFENCSSPKQRSEKPRLERMMGPISSSPSSSPKIERPRSARLASRASPPVGRKTSKERTSKSSSPPLRKKDGSCSDKAACCGLAGSPRVVHRGLTSPHASKRNVKEVSRLRKGSSGSSCSSSSTDDGRDSPADRARRRNRKDN